MTICAGTWIMNRMLRPPQSALLVSIFRHIHNIRAPQHVTPVCGKTLISN